VILAIIQIFGAEFELVIRPRGKGRPSLPPPTFDTNATPVEPTSAPGLARCLPASNVIPLRRVG
jgi:hypothetical protein